MKNCLGFEIEDNNQFIFFKCLYERCNKCKKLVPKSHFHCIHCKECHTVNNRYCDGCNKCVVNFNNHSKKICNKINKPTYQNSFTNTIHIVNSDAETETIINDEEYDVV